MLFQNIQQEMQHFENTQSSHSQAYDVQEHSYYNFTHQEPQPQEEHLHNLAPPQDNFSGGDVYLGINAVPSEIYRIENIRGNQIHAYNAMCAQSEANNFDLSRIAGEKNGHNPLQTASNNLDAYSCPGGTNYVEAYTKDQHGQGHLSGHYQGQAVSQGQSQNVSQSHRGKVLYQDDTNDSEGQCSSQGQFEILGQPQSYFHEKDHQCHQGQSYSGHGQLTQIHEPQGHQSQPRSYFKDYQYERHNQSEEYSSQNEVNHSENQSFLDQNMNYGHVNNSGNYLYAGGMSVCRHTSQDNSLNSSNSNYQEKTALPSFFQLSSQLAGNTTLSAGY